MNGLDSYISQLPDLPVKQVIPQLQEVLDTHNRAVLEAPPGAGKTTLVPLALLATSWRQKGKILVLEPRRLAAKAAAQRMSGILAEEVGKKVGYRIKLESRVSSETEIEVLTEGVLIRMLQEDPTLEGIAAIIFDEFHERSLQSDLGLALSLDVQSVLRPDLRILVMSATLNADRMGTWLGAPIVRSFGKVFPVEITYLKPYEAANAGFSFGEKLQNLVPKCIKTALVNHDTGDVLVFLPGIKEIRSIHSILERKFSASIEIHVLHGDLSLSLQQAAIQRSKSGLRKVILATSIAETSLTIEGVEIVVDGGFSRIPKFVPATGLTSLTTMPVSKAAADQRSGRAGRVKPGFCYRLWTTAEQYQLPDYQQPEILEADLSNLVLELSIWGARDPSDLMWLDKPPRIAFEQAVILLQKLEAVHKDRKPSSHGKKIASLGISPRLGHLIVKGIEIGHGNTACILASLLNEKDLIKRTFALHSNTINNQPDLRLQLDFFSGGGFSIQDLQVDQHAFERIKFQANHLRKRLNIENRDINSDKAGILCAFAFPDRIAKKEGHGQIRLPNGQKFLLSTEYFGGEDFFGIARFDGNNKTATLAAPITKEDLIDAFARQMTVVNEIKWDKESEKIVARTIKQLGAIVIEEFVLADPDQEVIADILLQAIKDQHMRCLNWTADTKNLLNRLSFLRLIDAERWPDISEETLLNTLDVWLRPFIVGSRSFKDLDNLDLSEVLLSLITWNQRNELEKMAPTHIIVPSGSKIPLDYSNPEKPVMAVRLQEIFGMTETPKIGGGQVSLLIHLLSPARRPVQVTQDLNSFWKTGYIEVRKILKGRYPKHSWPEDPLSAVAIKGTKKNPGII